MKNNTVFYSFMLLISIISNSYAMQECNAKHVENSEDLLFLCSIYYPERDIVRSLIYYTNLRDIVKRLDNFISYHDKKEYDHLVYQIINNYLTNVKNLNRRLFNKNVIDDLSDTIKNCDNKTLIKKILNVLKYYEIDVNKYKNSRGNLILTQAIYDKDLQLLEDLISLEEIDVNVKDKNGYVPLIVAVYGNFFDGIKILLKREDLDINTSYDSDTALTLAIHYGYDTVAQLLIEKNIDINAQDKYGNTALILSIKRKEHKNIYYDGRRNISRMLLSSTDVDINRQNNLGETALITAVIHVNLEMVRLLLENNANTDLRDSRDFTALDWANRLGLSDISDIICSY